METAESHKIILKRLDKIDENAVEHEKLDMARFANIPTKDEIGAVVEAAVNTQINGKLIGLKADNEEIKEHLKKQDLAMTELSAKINPFDIIKNWFKNLGMGLIYVGSIAVAIIAIYKLLQLIGWIK